VSRRAGRVGALLTAVATLPGLAACGQSTVDRKDLEAKIADFVARQTGTEVAVRCPDAVKADKGTVATCTTELAGAATNIKIVFTQKGKFRIAETRLQQP
jgi:hypothetical protein